MTLQDNHIIAPGGQVNLVSVASSGGSIHVQTPLLEIHDKGTIQAGSGEYAAGTGGEIKITSPGYLHLINSEITTSAKNSNAGKIILNSEFIILDDSYIKADADEGDAGNINIRTTG